ncbi:protein mono-ADP-ribosyltransferase PARP15-like [Thalassophryne amazonica]|uniref:protein mono-ADP-ribosyltransferase PARP15-like n=1 Tax=Thalassophryne amazonica TaxID=390379 RepID=UPI0014719321|nr:protein mono-ADP-ribosyltransferase PARP15-like [Thalassophryne amazonica]
MGLFRLHPKQSHVCWWFLATKMCYQEVCRQVNQYQQGQEICKSLACNLDELTLTVGGRVKLQLVQGDIAKETTDAVVNTTNFINFNTSTCKAILAKAGPEVEAALKTAKVDAGGIFVTQPGNFPCKIIFHVSGKGNTKTVEELVLDIISRCETAKLNSVAIPAICVGPGNLKPEAVAGAIFRAVHTSTSSALFNYLSTIRIILFETNVFLAFKQKAIQRFPSAAMSTASTL